MSAPPAGVHRDYPLARLTTVRTGGAADWFGRPWSQGELVEMLRWAADEGVALGVVGSGSNLLVADEGFHGWRSSSTASSRQDRTRRRGRGLRRRRPLSLGGGEGGGLGPLRASNSGSTSPVRPAAR